MILTLCGSARFEPVWHETNKQLGLKGHICFSLMTFPSVEGAKTWYTPPQKRMLDFAHFYKINNSDGVVMLNIDLYLGESSMNELIWARMHSKLIYWLEHDDIRRTRGAGTDREFALEELIGFTQVETILNRWKERGQKNSQPIP